MPKTKRLDPAEITPAATPPPPKMPPTTSSLDQFQTDEQRHVLDTIAHIRKCGLEGILSLPQLVVCGDQSAGKSSVMEALTEIPFPRNDNLCTRFATEVTLRRAPLDQLTLSIIPDVNRNSQEKATIQSFSETIVDFADLPRVMDKAKEVMGLSGGTSTVSASSKAFSRDVLSIIIEGPTRPQLTLVDLPGLIQTETKGVTRQDCAVVAEITQSYIEQPRTICLAIVSATHDHANQPILTKVRDVDPNGERTLGIITKPDKLEPNSGNEAMFLSLARNEDIFFQLGWHVIKNRKFNEADFSFDERNASESAFFRSSNFKSLPSDCVGIDALRTRLSLLLFDHIKRELPNLRRDLEQATAETTLQLDSLGAGRGTVQDCRQYLTRLSMGCVELSKAAAYGSYDDKFFQHPGDKAFSLDSPDTIKRFRAVIQYLNLKFTETVRKRGPKYLVGSSFAPHSDPISEGFAIDIEPPVMISKEEGLKWISDVMVRSRGREPYGNFNPLIIGELYWEQTEKWQAFAERHVDVCAQFCKKFFDILLSEKCPKDVQARLREFQIADTLKLRRKLAYDEVQKLMADNRDFPTTYNHYYTDTIQKQGRDRAEKTLSDAIASATTTDVNNGCQSGLHTSTNIDIPSVIAKVHPKVDQDMLHWSCEHVLDCLLAMYKVDIQPLSRFIQFSLTVCRTK